MRNLLCAVLLLICAVALSACSSPAKTARREVDRLLSITLTTDARLQRVTGQAFQATAETEGAALRNDLQRAGCTVLASSQPTTAPEECKFIAKAGRARYEARMAQIAAVAKRADDAITALWSVLRVTVDVIEDVELPGAPKPTLIDRLAALVRDCLRLAKDMEAAYNAVRTAAGGAK